MVSVEMEGGKERESVCVRVGEREKERARERERERDEECQHEGQQPLT